MPCKKAGGPLLAGILGCSLLVLCACSLFQGGEEAEIEGGEGADFTFNEPPGYKVIQYEYLTDSWMEAENLLFAQKKPVYFVIYRREAPEGHSLEEVFRQHLEKEEPPENHYQLISTRDVEIQGRPAIEYTYAHFHGETYVRTRETWVEDGGGIYILECSETINAGEVTGPVSEECGRLLEGFQLP